MVCVWEPIRLCPPNGGQVLVSSIDRLARSLADLRGIVDELTNKGVTVTFLHENLAFAKDTTDLRADLMLGILGSFGQVRLSGVSTFR